MFLLYNLSMINPKVSVIMPCYNASEYLDKSLTSLINQSLVDLEIIVVDDGSTDNSFEILKDYKNRYPHKIFIYQIEHSDVSAARNFGLSKVSGEYFGFLDSDDYCELNMFKELYEEAKREDADICFSNYYCTYDDHEELIIEPFYRNSKEMLVNVFTALWNKIYKTSLFKDNGILFSTGVNEDVMYLYENAINIKRFAKVEKAFVHYCIREGSLIHAYDNTVKQIVINWNTLYDYYKDKGLYDEYHDELEYATIKYMLGQPFKRASKIKGRERIKTIDMLWNNLNDNFPNWKNNKYLNSFIDNKHKFFRNINKYNYRLINKLLSFLK